MINLIYASKLYRSSKRKDKINAALLNSANLGLVQQLSEDLDEEYRDLNKSAKEQSPEDNPSTGSEGEQSDGSDIGPDLPKSLSSGLSQGSFNPSTDLVEFPEVGEMDESEPSGDSIESLSPDDSEPEAQEEAPVEESTQIKASSCIEIPDLNSIKGSLNLVESLAGVTRVASKEGEVWIYYNDDTNLNNIMTDVIDFIAKAYSSLEFNRLARSDNAIVFEVLCGTSDTAPSNEEDDSKQS